MIMKKFTHNILRLIALIFVFASLQAMAETQTEGRNFNHISTGFPLSGGHASAACETCHNGGVFKGTPRNCDGCHALGRRIVATPKSNSHIITDAPCESCHFNTVTWLGARFNHGTAKTGQCVTCHNGRIATGKPASHNVPPYSTNTCDQCHRSSAWYPNTWNHTDTASDCKICHKAGGPGRNYSSVIHNPTVLGAIANCKACHKNYYNFSSAYYDHAGASPLCDSCHGNAAYVGVKQKISAIHPVAALMSLTCQSCHKGFTSFGNAKFDHVGASTACNSCHGTYGAPAYSGVVAPTALIHSVLGTLSINNCNACHKTFSTFTVANYDHAGATQCSVCHSGTYSAAGIRGKSSGHIAYLASTPECSACHSTSSWGSTVSGLSLHTYLTTQTPSHSPTCRSCHAGAAHDGKDGANASMDCSQSGCHRPLGRKGASYQDWD
jgi:hypothetical protein